MHALVRLYAYFLYTSSALPLLSSPISTLSPHTPPPFSPPAPTRSQHAVDDDAHVEGMMWMYVYA